MAVPPATPRPRSGHARPPPTGARPEEEVPLPPCVRAATRVASAIGPTRRVAVAKVALGALLAPHRPPPPLADVAVPPVEVAPVAIRDAVGLARVRALRQRVTEVGRRPRAQRVPLPLPGGRPVAKVAVDGVIDVLGVPRVPASQRVVPFGRVLP